MIPRRIFSSVRTLIGVNIGHRAFEMKEAAKRGGLLSAIAG